MPSSGVARTTSTAAGAIAGAVLAGAIWVHVFDASDAALAGLLAAHALAGGALAIVLRFLPGLRSLGLIAAGLLAMLLLGALPAFVTATAPAASGAGDQLATLAIASAVVLALLELAARRLGPWPVRVLVALAAVPFVWLAFSELEPVLDAHAMRSVERADSPAGRVAVIGLDSADWAIIDPLIDAGEMPELARLLARGRSAVLLSSEPTSSPVVWTSIFSSRTPDEHGIRDWFSAHAANRRVGLLWEMAAAAGLSSIVVNVPGTWPPARTHGALVSGFPIPNVLLHPDRDRVQNVGTIVTRDPRPGPLYTQRARSDDDGVARADIELGAWQAPVRGRVGHFAVRWAIDRRWLPLQRVHLELTLNPVDEAGRMPIEVAGERFSLARRQASPWLTTQTVAGSLQLRMTRLRDDALFVTPAFQTAGEPIHAYTDSTATSDVVARAGRYVVEPAGWRSVDDPAARGALFEHLVDVEEMHVRATLALIDAIPDWALLVHVITLPDRVSHAFWPFHRPEDYDSDLVRGDAEDASRVVEAYRLSDRLLGQLMARLGDETAVLIVSDHGTASQPGLYGGHRIEGILAAAGPGVVPGDRRTQASIMDVTPLALRLLGLPVALDFAGTLPEGFDSGLDTSYSVPSYETAGQEDAAPTETIDESTREQLRGLGYIE